jgi:putative ABC transport system permease protein
LTTIVAGWITGTLVAIIAVPLGIRRALTAVRQRHYATSPSVTTRRASASRRDEPRRHDATSLGVASERASASGVKTKQEKSSRRSMYLAWTGAFLCIAVLIAGVRYHSVSLFMVMGLLLMFTAAFAGDYLILSRGAPDAALSESKLIWGSLLANRKRVWLSFFTLATGVFLVFAVGLNRKGFSNSSELVSGTGGYTLWCETTVPVYHNLSTPEGRQKLSLNGLPAGTEILQLSRYGVDDAGCLNLNRVSQPSVLGVDMQAIRNGGFRMLQTLQPEGSDMAPGVSDMSGSPSSPGNTYPVLIDETVLTWSLMRKLGDTIRYNTGDRSVNLLLSGTLDNTIFQGYLLLDISLFSEIWRETAGSEIILFKTAENEIAGVKQLVEQALHEYGVRVSTTARRLQEFNSVMDTYLTIFLTLGGLGLLLGIAGFIVVLRKDLASRRKQIRLFRALGFSNRRIARLLIAENRIVPLYAIVAGSAGALAGTSVGIVHISAGVALPAFVLALLLVVCVVIFIRKSVYTCLSEN